MVWTERWGTREGLYRQGGAGVAWVEAWLCCATVRSTVTICDRWHGWLGRCKGRQQRNVAPSGAASEEAGRGWEWVCMAQLFGRGGGRPLLQ